MARARTIKPAFFTSEQVASCSPLARLLFVGLWCICDRAGKLRDRPRKIKAELLPYEALQDVDGLLGELAAAGLILRYSVAGEAYLKVPEFMRHQNPHPREPPSEIPEPCFSTAEPDLSTAEPDLSTAENVRSVSSRAFNPSPLSPLPSPDLPSSRWIVLGDRLTSEQKGEVMAEWGAGLRAIEDERLVPSEARYRADRLEDELLRKWSTLVGTPEA